MDTAPNHVHPRRAFFSTRLLAAATALAVLLWVVVTWQQQRLRILVGFDQAPTFDVSALVGGTWFLHEGRWVRGVELGPSHFRPAMKFKANGYYEVFVPDPLDRHHFVPGQWQAAGKFLHVHPRGSGVQYCANPSDCPVAEPATAARVFEVASIKQRTKQRTAEQRMGRVGPPDTNGDELVAKCVKNCYD